MLILRPPWYSQPQEITAPSPEYQFLYLGTPLGESAGEQPAWFGAIGGGVSVLGRTLDFDSANLDTPARRLEWADSVRNSHTGALTVVCAFVLRTPPSRANRGLVAKNIGTSGGVGVDQRSWALYVDYQTSGSINYLRMSCSSAGTGASNILSAAGSSLSNGAHVGVGVYVPSTSITTYLDGTLNGQTTSSVPASLFNSTSPVWVGTQFSTTDAVGNSQYCLAGGIALYAVLPYAVTQEQARLLSINPWQLFDNRRIYIPTTITSGAYTLNLETGTYSFTGSDAVLIKNSQLTLDSGTYSLTGSNASMLKGLILEASSGTYTLSGSVASLLYTHLLSASSGTYTVNGADATLTYTPGSGAYTLNAETGTYLLTGSDVTFISSGAEVTLKAGSWIRYRIIT